MHTGHVEYAEPLCGHAMSYLLSFYMKSDNKEISKTGIEVKVESDECLAKNAAAV